VLPLGALGRDREGLAVAEEAVGLERPLARDTPARQPGLARALGNLGSRLATLGRGREGLAVAEEAVGLLRPLAQDNPALQPNLAALTAVIPTVFAAVILAIAYDQRVALAYGALFAPAAQLNAKAVGLGAPCPTTPPASPASPTALTNLGNHLFTWAREPRDRHQAPPPRKPSACGRCSPEATRPIRRRPTANWHAAPRPASKARDKNHSYLWLHPLDDTTARTGTSHTNFRPHPTCRNDEVAPACSHAPGSQVSPADQRRITGGAALRAYGLFTTSHRALEHNSGPTISTPVPTPIARLLHVYAFPPGIRTTVLPLAERCDHWLLR
jgi:hypothetical protein